LKTHGFSRADSAGKLSWALAPEEFFRKFFDSQREKPQPASAEMKMHLERIEFGIAGATLLCALAGLSGRAQAAPSRTIAPAVPAAISASSLQVVREIDDPSNGNRWLLVRDWNLPGGPGRLLLLASSSVAARHAAAPQRQPVIQNPPSMTVAFAGLLSAAPAAPVIHSGDALIVEEKTPIVDARLAATSLGTAPVGALLSARLEIGGKVIRVRALSPGRAAFETGPAPEAAMGAEP
jgi:hypothetical protein